MLPDSNTHTGSPPFLTVASQSGYSCFIWASRTHPCPGFFGSNSQSLPFSWSQSLTWVYPSPLATQATWPQNFAEYCVLFHLSSSLLTWSQTPYFLLSIPSSTRVDTQPLFGPKLLLLLTKNIYWPADGTDSSKPFGEKFSRWRKPSGFHHKAGPQGNTVKHMVVPRASPLVRRV